MFEQAEGYVLPQNGNLALKPEFRKGWKTYNFEVEGFHTYVAGGVRVHNDSWNDNAGYEYNAQTGWEGAVVTGGYDPETGARIDGRSIPVDAGARDAHEASLSTAYADSPAGKAESAAYGATMAGASFADAYTAGFNEYIAKGGDNQTEAVLVLVGAGVYLGFFSNHCTDMTLYNFKELRPDVFRYSSPICAIWRGDRNQSAVLQQFLELIAPN